MIEHPTLLSSIVLKIANIRAIILLIKQNDDGSDQEISEDKCEDLGESTLSSNI